MGKEKQNLKCIEPWITEFTEQSEHSLQNSLSLSNLFSTFHDTSKVSLAALTVLFLENLKNFFETNRIVFRFCFKVLFAKIQEINWECVVNCKSF